MVDPSIVELGAGGLVAYIIIREVLGFLSRRKNDDNASSSTGRMQLMQKQVQDLHEWHNVNDDDGVKRWYVKHSLENTIQNIADAINTQNQILHQLTVTNDMLLKVIEKMRE